MKRLFFFAIAAVLLVACDKNTDQEAPTITWPANPGFAQFEMGTGKDATVSLNAPAKIEAVTLTLGIGDFILLANPKISIGANKSSNNKLPVFDIIDDASVASFLSGLSIAAGSGLRGKTMTVIDLEAILNALLEGQNVPNNTNFSIDIKLTDQAGKSVSKVAKFHYTVPPTISWSDNDSFATVDLNNYSPSKTGPSKVRISAPGKISDLLVTLEYGAAAELAKYVTNRTTGGVMVIDIINDPKAEEAFKFPSAKVVSGKTEAALDFAFIYNLIPDLSAGTNVFTVKVVDANGKLCSEQLKFKK